MKKDKYKNIRVMPSLILKTHDGKEVTYVYEGKPMTKDEYVQYQKSLSEGITTTFSMRIVKK